MSRGEELRTRAMSAVRTGNFYGARKLLGRARTAAGDDPNQLALVSLSEAYVDAELNGVAAAIPTCRTLLGAPELDEHTRGRVWAQLGLLHMRGGHAVDAMAAFDEAIGRLQDAPEHLGRVLLNRGTLQLGQQHAVDGVEDFRAAARQFEHAGLEIQAAKAQHNVGYASLLEGDLVGALATMESAARVLAPLSPVSRAQCEQDRAEVLLAAGRAREASTALRTAAAAYGDRRLRRFQAECELVLARTLLREDPKEARRVARRSARRFAAHGAPIWANRAEAVAIAAAVASGERSPGLVTRADELEADLRRDGLAAEADRLALLASRLVLRRGDVGEAARRATRVRLPAGASIPLVLLRHEVRADLASARHRRADALREIRRGLTELHQWQSSFGSVDLQSTLVGHGQGLAARGLDLVVEQQTPGLVYEWSERARALVGRVAPVRPPRDEAIAGDLATLRQLPAGDRRRTEIANRIAHRAWAAPGGGEIGEPAPLDELQSALGEAALVAYVVRPHRMAAVVVTAAHAEVVDLGEPRDLRDQLDAVAADLDMAASRTDGPMAEAIRSSLHRGLHRIADRLVVPVLPRVGDRRMVLTPSSILAGTPWGLLPGLVGRPLTVPQSATSWLRHREGGRPLAAVGLVAGPRVERADDEVRAAAKAWDHHRPGPEVLLGAAASARAVTALAERVDVLHVAGHGRHSGENPLFSAVELADGPWFGYDIDTLARTPSTVVLSACELGRVSVRSGEEAVGMTAAWLHAGARHVLSSPSLVADEVACDALGRWHALLASGAAPAEALAAVGEALHGGPPLPFLCFGAGW